MKGLIPNRYLFGVNAEKTKALELLLGGLDSILTVKLILEREITVEVRRIYIKIESSHKKTAHAVLKGKNLELRQI